MKSSKRSKLAFLVLGAVVAIGGTVATSFIESHYQGDANKAQSKFTAAQAQIQGSNALLNLAQQQWEHAEILRGDRNSVGGWETNAKALAFYSVYQLQTLEQGTNESSAVTQQALGVRPAPCNQQAQVYLTSQVRDSAILQRCYQNELAQIQKANGEAIADANRTVKFWATVGTFLQLTGIGIAFLKDLVPDE